MSFGTSANVRRRAIRAPVLPASSYKTKSTFMWLPDRTTYGGASFPLAPKGKQITASEGHPWPPRKGRVGDVGGEFSTEKTFVEFRSTPVTYKVGPFIVDIKRSFYDPTVILDWSARETTSSSPLLAINPNAIPGDPFPPSTLRSNADLDKAGATAIARCKPTNSVADLSTFLGETLREGLPKIIGAALWKKRTSDARQAVKTGAGEHLNVEFGWKPFVSDLSKLAEAISNAERVLAQYERDAGRQVRRRYSFPSERESSSTVYAEDAAPYGSFHSDVADQIPRGQIVRTVETVRDTWFSGAFTYYLPTGYDSRKAFLRNSLMADKLLGTHLTPEVIWNLTPWSWAVDWFSNAGDVISNLSDYATDGLILRYGYIMEHTVSRVTYSMRSVPSVSPVSFVRETKVRRRANPFGFGMTWDGLSPRQIAIAGALGLNKGL